MWWHHLFVQLLTLLSCCIDSGGVSFSVFLPLSLLLQSITLTAAWSILLACCSILWQETFLLLLYGFLLHYCTELVMDLTLYSTPGSALQSNFSFQHWTLSGDNEAFLWLCWCHHFSVCPSTPRGQLTGKQIIQNNGKDGCSAVNLKPIFPNITWLMFRLCFQLEIICQHPLYIMFSFFSLVSIIYY